MIANVSVSGLDGITAKIRLLKSNKIVEFDQDHVKRVKRIIAENDLTPALEFGKDWEYAGKEDLIYVVRNRKPMMFAGDKGLPNFLQWIERLSI